MSISKVAPWPLVLRTRTEPARLAAEVRLGTGSCPVAPRARPRSPPAGQRRDSGADIRYMTVWCGWTTTLTAPAVTVSFLDHRSLSR